MRWLFLILLTINLLLFLWNWQLPDQGDSRDDIEVSGIGNLKLLSEREAAGIEPGSEEIELAGIPTLSKKDDDPGGRKPSSEPGAGGIAPGSEAVELAGIPTEFKKNTGSGAQIKDEIVEAPGETEPTGPLIAENADSADKNEDPGLAGTLSETLESSDAADLKNPLSTPEISEEKKIEQLEQPAPPYPETATSHAILEEPDIPISFCGTLGPVPEGEVARSAIEELESRGIEASLRRETIKQQAGYWVIIPPYENGIDAVEAEKKLKEYGFADIWRFYKGEFKNGISLGMYSRKRNAETRRESVVETGFSPEVLPRYRDVVMHWIDYRIEGEENLSALDMILLAYPELKREKVECPHIAVPKGIF